MHEAFCIFVFLEFKTVYYLASIGKEKFMSKMRKNACFKKKISSFPFKIIKISIKPFKTYLALKYLKCIRAKTN